MPCAGVAVTGSFYCGGCALKQMRDATATFLHAEAEQETLWVPALDKPFNDFEREELAAFALVIHRLNPELFGAEETQTTLYDKELLAA